MGLRMNKNLLETIVSTCWAIKPEALEGIYHFVNRDGIKVDRKTFHGSPSTFASFVDGLPMLREATNVHIKNGKAILPIEGPIIPKANLFSNISGIASISTLMSDFQIAEESSDVQEIVLLIDSPGGAITGIHEFATMVNESSKTTIAYVYGMAASAAYWIASACNRSYIDKTGEVGSIGVVASYTDTSERDKREGVKHIEIVSTLSPNKRQDISKDPGRQKLIGILDGLAKIFIEDVANFRGTSFDDVYNNYGQGDMFLAKDAVDKGMVDGISSLTDVILTKGIVSTTNKGGNMSLTKDKLKAEHHDVYQSVFQEGVASVNPGFTSDEVDAKIKEAVTQERNRIKSIDDLSIAGAEDIISKAKADGSSPEKVAMTILKAQKEGTLPIDTGFTADAKDLGKQSKELGSSSGDYASEEEELKAISEDMAEGIK